MSETIKAAEAMKKATDQTARSSQANIDAASKATKESIYETSRVAQGGIDSARGAVEGMTETVADTATAAADASSKAVDQGREAMMMGMRTAAGVGCRVADISFGRGQRLLASAASAMDIYRDASERSAERMQALFSSYMTFGRGLQSMQHALLEIADHTMENAARKPQDLLRCKTITELAEVQRDLYIDALSHAVESTSRLLEIASRSAQEAVRPLQPHAR